MYWKNTEMGYISPIKILFLQCDDSSLEEKLTIQNGPNESILYREPVPLNKYSTIIKQ